MIPWVRGSSGRGHDSHSHVMSNSVCQCACLKDWSHGTVYVCCAFKPQYIVKQNLELTHRHKHRHTHTHIRTRKHVCTYTLTSTSTHTHTHTHTHARPTINYTTGDRCVRTFEHVPPRVCMHAHHRKHLMSVPSGTGRMSGIDTATVHVCVQLQPLSIT